jgi:hypothetical protein
MDLHLVSVCVCVWQVRVWQSVFRVCKLRVQCVMGLSGLIFCARMIRQPSFFTMAVNWHTTTCVLQKSASVVVCVCMHEPRYLITSISDTI